ncbi:MAG TPA: hypothetical protein VGC13_27770, partial [Longimicrobium sp.]
MVVLLPGCVSVPPPMRGGAAVPVVLPAVAWLASSLTVSSDYLTNTKGPPAGAVPAGASLGPGLIDCAHPAAAAQGCAAAPSSCDQTITGSTLP